MSWHEQAVTIPVPDAGLVLDGVWQRGEGRAAVVAPPHPEYGGSLDNPVVNEIAHALYRHAYASLRFNWRGVGGSQGQATGNAAAAEADYAAALDHVARTLDVPITAAGYSFGAATALRVGLRDARVRRLVLVAPPVAMIEGLSMESLAVPLCVVAGELDRYAPPDRLAAWVEPLPRTELRVIPGADHFFSRSGLAELAAAVFDWAAPVQT